MLTAVLKSKTKALYQSQSLRQASVLFLGNAGSQLLSLLSFPLLARLYTPAQFGEFAFLNSLLAILLVAASARYETAIILSKNSIHAKRLFQLAQWILIGYMLALYGVLLLPPIQEMLQARNLSPLYIWILPILVFFGGYWQIVQSWLTRFQRYKRLSSVLFIQRLAIFLMSLAAFFITRQLNGLVLGLVSGMAIVFGLSLYFQRQTLNAPFVKLLGFARSYRDFPLYSVPALLISIGTLHLPIFWFTFFYSPQLAGSYSLAFSIILIPVAGLRTSFGHVFYQRVAQTKIKDRYQLLISYCRKYSYFLAPVALILTFFGKPLVAFLLGESWLTTARIISLLAPIMLAQGLSGLLLMYLNTSRRQQTSFILNLLYLLLWLLALGIGLKSNDFYLSFKLISVFSYLQLFLSFMTVRKFHRKMSSD